MKLNGGHAHDTTMTRATALALAMPLPTLSVIWIVWSSIGSHKQHNKLDSNLESK